MAKAKFPACLAFTLKQEGGKSDDARDPGGRTNQGVTQATYDAWRASKGAAPADVFLMPTNERDAIYRQNYWNAVNGDALRPGEDLVVFDYAVNSGPARALAAWRAAGGSYAPSADIIHSVCARRLSFLQALRTWQYFGAGWGRRVAQCEATATAMAFGKAAPGVIAVKVRDARSKKAAAGGAVAGAAGVAAIGVGAQILHGAGWLGTAIVGVLILAGAVAAYNALRQGQRADGLQEALNDLAARKRALDASHAAEQAQKAATQANIIRQQQQVEAANRVEGELGIRVVAPVSTATAADPSRADPPPATV